MDDPPPHPGAATDVLLRDHLAANDTPCPSCGYNLRGTAGDACPECNAALGLIVSAERDGIIHYPRPAAVSDTFGQLGLAAGVILHALFVFGFGATLEPELLVLSGVMLLVSLANAGLWWLWLRRMAWMGRQLPAVRVLLAFAGWWWIPGWMLAAATVL